MSAQRSNFESRSLRFAVAGCKDRARGTRAAPGHACASRLAGGEIMTFRMCDITRRWSSLGPHASPRALSLGFYWFGDAGNASQLICTIGNVRVMYFRYHLSNIRIANSS